MPYLNEHAARIKDPNTFDKIKRQNNKFGEGIDVLWGIKDNKISLQAIRFNASKYNEDEAKKWLKERDYKYISFESAIKKVNELLKELKPNEVMDLFKGSSSSGNYGHSGRPGEVGGSSVDSLSSYQDKNPKGEFDEKSLDKLRETPKDFSGKFVNVGNGSQEFVAKTMDEYNRVPDIVKNATDSIVYNNNVNVVSGNNGMQFQVKAEAKRDSITGQRAITIYGKESEYRSGSLVHELGHNFIESSNTARNAFIFNLDKYKLSGLIENEKTVFGHPDPVSGVFARFFNTAIVHPHLLESNYPHLVKVYKNTLNSIAGKEIYAGKVVYKNESNVMDLFKGGPGSGRYPLGSGNKDINYDSRFKSYRKDYNKNNVDKVEDVFADFSRNSANSKSELEIYVADKLGRTDVLHDVSYDLQDVNTQELLDKEINFNKETFKNEFPNGVEAYRGVTGKLADRIIKAYENGEKQISIRTTALESFTLSLDTAKVFARIEKGSAGVVFKYEVKPEHVINYYKTRPSRDEFVLLEQEIMVGFKEKDIIIDLDKVITGKDMRNYDYNKTMKMKNDSVGNLGDNENIHWLQKLRLFNNVPNDVMDLFKESNIVEKQTYLDKDFNIVNENKAVYLIEIQEQNGELISENFCIKNNVIQKGGQGSGNFGHSGRPGEVGGSSTEGNILEKPFNVNERWKNTSYYNLDIDTFTELRNKTEKLIPQKIKDAVKYKVYYRNSKMESRAGKGYTVSASADIRHDAITFYRRDSNIGDKEFQAIYLHEIGHLIQSHGISSFGESVFNDLYNNYKNKLPSKYAETDVREAFAECFSAYYMKGKLDSTFKSYFKQLKFEK